MQKNDLTHFNAGGSHASNPNGGIPIGMGSNGKPNSVEEGETMKNDFIYSDRITLSKEMVEQFKLPKSLANKTAAEASKILDAKFNGRNDKISTSTKTSMLDRIAQAQEAVKQAQMAQIAESMQANSTDVPDMMNGEVPQGFAYGGPMNKFLLGGDSIDTTSNNSNMFGYTAGQADDPTGGAAAGGGGEGFVDSYGGAIGSALGGIGSGLSANRKQNQFQSNDLDRQDKTHQQVSGVKDTVASAIGPWGMLFRGIEKLGQGVGDSVGGNAGAGITGAFSPDEAIMRNNQDSDSSTWEKIGGIFNPIGASINVSKNEKARQAKKQGELARSMNSMFDDRGYAYGGKMNKFAEGGPIGPEPYQYDSFPTGVYDSNNLGFPYGQYSAPAGMPSNPNAYNSYSSMGESVANEQARGTGQGIMPTVNKAANWLGNNYGDILRYAPVAANAYQLSQLKKPQFEGLNRLTNRYKPSYVDEAGLQKVVGQELNNTSNAIQNSGGSQGAVRNSLLAAQLQKTKSMSDAYMNARQINAGQDAVAQNFNLGVDQTNLQQSNLEGDINARNQANYDTQKSKLIGQLGTDVGEIGKEEVYKKIAKEAFGYKWDGTYWIKPDGTKTTTAEVKKEANSAYEAQNTKSLGGYFTKRK